MSTNGVTKPASEPSAATGQPNQTDATFSPAASSKQKSSSFDIVQTYRELLKSDPDMTMPVAAIEALIEVLSTTPSSTAMETVEIVKKETAKLLASAPNPLPLLAGTDLFEQFLLRSLRGPAAGDSAGHILPFEQTRQHLLDNRQLFAQRAKAARDDIAQRGARYITDRHIVLTIGGSRTVTKILLRAAADPSKHFKVIYVVDDVGQHHGNANGDGNTTTTSTTSTASRSRRAVAQLREAGLEVETISPHKVAYVLGNQKAINLVLVGTEVVLQNGGIISGMGTAQLAHLTKSVCGGPKRFYVAAETHKICRRTPIAYPMVNRVGVRQRDISKFDNVAVFDDGADVLAEADEVDYTDPELIDGFITEQGIKMTSQIWAMVDDYI